MGLVEDRPELGPMPRTSCVGLRRSCGAKGVGPAVSIALLALLGLVMGDLFPIFIGKHLLIFGVVWCHPPLLARGATWRKVS